MSRPEPPVRPLGPPTPTPDGWTAAELDTLTAVADTFVAGGAPRRARLAADALNLAADPDQVLQLRLVLRAFDSRLANLLLTGRTMRFRRLDLAGRERYLRSWATSRIPQRRAAYQGLKRLLAFLAYADPGEDGENPLLAEIGYEHRPEPVTADPSPIVPLDVRYLAATTPGDGPIAAEGGPGDAAAFDAFVARLRDFDFAPNRGTVASAHQMGSARAGGPPRDYPCDPFGRVRASGARPGRDATIPGLYVGDASLFPTALGVNPMITTMVWARRVARMVLSETARG